MKAKLEQLDARLAELNSLLVQEEITKDMDQYRKLNREHAEISPVVEQFQLFLQAEADEQAALAMQADPEMKDFAEEELKSAKTRMENMQADLQRLLLPKDPNDDKNVIFRENDLTKGSFHIVEIGQVTTKRKHNDRGDYIGILCHEEGDIIGEQAYFGFETRKERAIVTSGRVKLREINKSAFEKLINIHTDFYVNFIKVMLWKSYIIEQKIKSI